jgi:DNA-binding NarL/FixJ family response regulator
MTRIVLADDSGLLRESLRRVLEAQGIEVVAVCEDGTSLLRLADEHRPDVVLSDIRMPPTHTDEGLRAVLEVRAKHPGIGVLLLSQYAEAEYGVRLLQEAGRGVGYLLKDRVADGAALADAVRQVQQGGVVVDPDVVELLLHRPRVDDGVARLTERERDVLQLLAEGLTNLAVAKRLVLSTKTVETHVASVFTKLDLAPAPDGHRRVLAVLRWLRNTPTSS